MNSHDRMLLVFMSGGAGEKKEKELGDWRAQSYLFVPPVEFATVTAHSSQQVRFLLQSSFDEILDRMSRGMRAVILLSGCVILIVVFDFRSK